MLKFNDSSAAIAQQFSFWPRIVRVATKTFILML
jgi:hypothetical protein